MSCFILDCIIVIFSNLETIEHRFHKLHRNIHCDRPGKLINFEIVIVWPREKAYQFLDCYDQQGNLINSEIVMANRENLSVLRLSWPSGKAYQF